MKKIDLLFFDAGGGHRSAATALRHAIVQQGRDWDVRLVNLQEVLDSLDIFRKLTGIRMEDIYNLLLKKGWTLGSPQLTRAMHGIIRMYHPAQVRVLRKFWKTSQPDLVVSVIPNFNRAIHQSLPSGIPMVTILTDLADYPPHFWMERQEQYWICGTGRAVTQAQKLGHGPEKIFQTSGMILHPRFYEPVNVDRREERRRLGLDPDLPTGLVLFGGHGSGVMLEIAKRLQASDLKLQLIFVCGHNNKLAEALRRISGPVPMYIEGFTKEIPYLMRLSDFFIGKPGPGSISEALAMQLPVIVERNAWTLPQERYNAEWIREQGVGLVLRNFREIASAVRKLLDPDQYRVFRKNAAALNNRAVFEIPEILERILAGHPRP